MLYSTDEEERNEVKNTIQQTVSHFTSNTNKVRPIKEYVLSRFDQIPEKWFKHQKLILPTMHFIGPYPWLDVHGKDQFGTFESLVSYRPTAPGAAVTFWLQIGIN